ncbi:MAG: carboxypeptidase regulatory-like domain-containing protein [Gemmatimonadota bacterium]
MTGFRATPPIPGLPLARLTTPCLALLSLLVLAWPGAVYAQGAPTGRVVGTVVDSTTMQPLADAAVVLWDTRHRTVSDSLGRFAIDSVAPGTYSAVFFHTRLGILGVSAGPRPVEVHSGRTAGVELAIPSSHTIEAAQCAFAEVQGGTVVGQVTDPASGTGLPTVRVRFSWTEEDGEREAREVRSDATGWYRVCDLPRARTVAVAASFLDRLSPRREIVVQKDPVALDLALTPLELSDVRGRLVDAESGDGIGGAAVGLVNTGFLVVSEPDGDFHFNDVLPGEYRLQAEHLAYGVRQEGVNVASGAEVRLEMALSQRPIELPPIRVEVASTDIMDMAMGGTVISSEELDAVRDRSRDVLDLLRNQGMAGLVIKRQAGEFCVGFVPGQSRMFRTGSCVPAVVFVDNVRASVPRMAVDLPAEVVERVVLYRPVEAGNLFGLGGGNGVIMIFTKR